MFGLCVVFYIWTAIYLCYYIAIIFLYIIITKMNIVLHKFALENAYLLLSSALLKKFG
jgi:hypothetical protein